MNSSSSPSLLRASSVIGLSSFQKRICRCGLCITSSALPRARLARVASLLRSKARGRSGAVELDPAGRLVLVVELRRGPEEALLADLALVGALGQVGMRLARGGALDLAQRNPVLGHGFLLMPLCLQHAAADLVELDRFEQRAEVALAEALVALALDDLEEDRADHRLGEDLQQQPAALGRRAVDQDAVGGAGASGPRRGPAGARRPARSRCRACPGTARPCARSASTVVVDVVGAERDVLDALAVIGDEVFLDLRLVVGALVDRDADLAARAGHRLAT